MKVVVTGTGNGLSAAVSEAIQEKCHADIVRLSMRGEEWKGESFSGVDAIVHIVGVTPGTAKSKEEYYQINTDVTKALAAKAKQEGVKHFVFFSSMAVYGLEQSMVIEAGTIHKNTFPNPVTDYGKSKRMAEESLQQLRDDTFRITLIRLPSIYSRGRTEYLDQYRYLADKLPWIPTAFQKNYKSAIFSENLSELVTLIIKNPSDEIICPDDGQYAATDYCSAIEPHKRKSRFLGKLIELFLKNNDRIRDYYGCICYSKELTDVYNGKYRIASFQEGIKRAYTA